MGETFVAAQCDCAPAFVWQTRRSTRWPHASYIAPRLPTRHQPRLKSVQSLPARTSPQVPVAFRKTRAHAFRLANTSSMARSKQGAWRLDLEALVVQEHCVIPRFGTPSPMAATKVSPHLGTSAPHYLFSVSIEKDTGVRTRIGVLDFRFRPASFRCALRKHTEIFAPY